jgi:type I restriction enzyme S subunit
MLSRYLLYFLRHIEGGWESKATGTTFSAISGKVLRNQSIPLLPLVEQRQIVTEIEKDLSRLDLAVAMLERVQIKLKRFRAAVLGAAYEGRLYPKATTLGRACEVVLGQSPPSSTYNMKGVGLPFYQGKAEFGDLFPSPSRWCSEPIKVAEAGDVLISVRAPVGPTNLCRERSCIGRGLAALRPRGEMLSRYLLYFLRHIEGGWESKATGTTFSAISGKVLRNQSIPLLPLAEQRQVVAKVEQRLSAVAGVEATVDDSLTRALLLRQAIFERAFISGRVAKNSASLPHIK